jgi:hypothetical protein
MLDDDGQVCDNTPLDVFWLKIEPSYVAKNRAAGKMDDRTSLNILEKKLAYGVSIDAAASEAASDAVGDGIGVGVKVKVLKMVSLPSRCVTLTVDEAGKAVTRIHINGVSVVLKKIYVFAVERWLNPIPRVEYVDVFGVNDKGEAVSERVLP